MGSADCSSTVCQSNGSFVCVMNDSHVAGRVSLLGVCIPCSVDLGLALSNFVYAFQWESKY